MQIILEEHEIKAALVAYANSIVQLKDDQEIDIEMKAGRGENGYSATLNVTTKVQASSTKTTRASKPPVVETAKAEVITAAPVKAGLFNKPAVIAEAQAQAEEPVAGISTGEDRGEAEEVITEEERAEAESRTEEPVVATQVEAEAPVEKPKSIFNFQKPAANG